MLSEFIRYDLSNGASWPTSINPTARQLSKDSGTGI